MFSSDEEHSADVGLETATLRAYRSTAQLSNHDGIKHSVAATNRYQPQTSLQPERPIPILPSTNSKCHNPAAAHVNGTRSSCLLEVFDKQALCSGRRSQLGSD